MTQRRVPISSQQVDAPLTCAATFLVLSIKDPGNKSALVTIRSTLAGIDGLIKNVAVRDLTAAFACSVGIGADAWDLLVSTPRPTELHPFREVKGAEHVAVSTPGDLLFHIRAERRDLCFEFERQLMEKLAGVVEVVDQTVGFRYFDLRDLLGFVDGTANPVGQAVEESVMVRGEDGAGEGAPGGSYVVVQKYLHDLAAWRGLSVETQESIVGRTKLENVELDDIEGDGQKAHKTLATIEENGEEFDILRDNMPFGSPAQGEFGTYFIGYSRRLWVVERMLERMFVGDPPGKHDRILDYSRAVTGTVFFAPAAEVLAGLD
jgi:porphyrinogen peroxidase